MPPLILTAQKTKADILTFSTKLWISGHVATQNDTSYLCKPPLLFRGQAQAHTSYEGQLRLPREEPQNCCWCCAPNLSAGLSSAQHKWLEGHIPKRYTREQAARSCTQLCANSIGETARSPSSMWLRNLWWRWRPEPLCQDTDCCTGPLGRTSNVHMHWQMFMLVILI